MRYIPHEYQRYCEERIVNEPFIGLFLEMGLGPRQNRHHPERYPAAEV